MSNEKLGTFGWRVPPLVAKPLPFQMDNYTPVPQLNRIALPLDILPELEDPSVRDQCEVFINTPPLQVRKTGDRVDETLTEAMPVQGPIPFSSLE